MNNATNIDAKKTEELNSFFKTDGFRIKVTQEGIIISNRPSLLEAGLGILTACFLLLIATVCLQEVFLQHKSKSLISTTFLLILAFFVAAQSLKSKAIKITQTQVIIYDKLLFYRKPRQKIKKADIAALNAILNEKTHSTMLSLQLKSTNAECTFFQTKHQAANATGIWCELLEIKQQSFPTAL